MEFSTLLIYYTTTNIMLLIFLKIYEILTSRKEKYNLKKIIICFLSSMIIMINNIFAPPTLCALINNIVYLFVYKMIYKDHFKITLFYALIIATTLFSLDLLVALFLPLGIKNVDFLNNIVVLKVFVTIIVNGLLYLILTNKYVVKFLKDFIDTSKTNKMFYATGILGFVICNVWVIYSSSRTSDKTLNIILAITEIIILVFIILNIQNKYEKNISKIKEEQLKQNLELYTKVANEYKELKHNLMNDFLIIKSKLPKKEQPFINEIINKYKSNYEWVNSITDIPEGLQGLVFLKKHQAEMKKIHFNFESNISKNANIDNNLKLYESLGIIFDNAIEAAEESQEKIINVIFSDEKNKFIIKIMNTFNNSIDLDKIGNKNYSTKNRGSGIGLNYIKKQKKKFKINQSIINNIFNTEILISKPEKPKKKSS